MPRSQKQSLTYQERSQKFAQERKRRPVIRKTLFVTKVVIGIIIGSAAYWFYATGELESGIKITKREAYDLTTKAGLNLNNIYVDGLENLDTEAILAALPEDFRQREVKPIMEISLPELKENLEQLGWVKYVEIKRELPDALRIIVSERKPVAIWQYEGELALVDIDGVLISRTDVPLFPDLPIVVGRDAHHHIHPLFEFMEASPDIMKRVSALIWVSERRWNVRMDNGIEIKLPEHDTEKAWHYLTELHQNKRLLDREVEFVDLRDMNKTYIKPRG